MISLSSLVKSLLNIGAKQMVKKKIEIVQVKSKNLNLNVAMYYYFNNLFECHDFIYYQCFYILYNINHLDL